MIDMIAEGGFSYVYKARDSKHTNYALKKIIVQSPEAELDVNKEVEMLMRFRHANIIELLESCFIREGSTQVAYLLFPYYEKSLRYILDEAHGRDMKIPLLKILKQFKDVCEAVEVIHDQNFVHNDIKPENVLVGVNGASSSFCTTCSHADIDCTLMMYTYIHREREREREWGGGFARICLFFFKV